MPERVRVVPAVGVPVLEHRTDPPEPRPERLPPPGPPVVRVDAWAVAIRWAERLTGDRHEVAVTIAHEIDPGRTEAWAQARIQAPPPPVVPPALWRHAKGKPKGKRS